LFSHDALVKSCRQHSFAADVKNQDNKMKSWRDAPGLVNHHLLHMFGIVVTIVAHGGLFFLWILLDHLAHDYCESYKSEGFHGSCVVAFRWIASAQVFAVAVVPSISDIIDAAKTIRKKIGELMTGNEPLPPSGLNPEGVGP
jgi:hypothetical protein